MKTQQTLEQAKIKKRSVSKPPNTKAAWSITARIDVITVATDAEESVVRKAAFSLSWLNVFLVLESFCLLLLSRELPRLGRSIGRMYCCSGQANICTY